MPKIYEYAKNIPGLREGGQILFQNLDKIMEVVCKCNIARSVEHIELCFISIILLYFFLSFFLADQESGWS